VLIGLAFLLMKLKKISGTEKRMLSFAELAVSYTTIIKLIWK